MFERKCRGVTLLELLVVVIIIGILGTMILPRFYNNSRERAMGLEAKASLKLIAAAEKIYRMESNPTSYYPGDGSSRGVGDINTDLKLSLTATNWTYSVTSDASTFTAYALRVPGYGSYSNCIYTLTHDDADGEPDPNFVSLCP